MSMTHSNTPWTEGWRFDVENAPKGRMVERNGPKGSTVSVHQPELVIVAAADGETVTLSRWLPKEERWNMLGKKEAIVAWMPWPSHPAPRASKASPVSEGEKS